MHRLIALAVPILLAASASAPVARPPAIAAAAARAMAQTGAKGLAVAVIDKGRVVSVQSFGTRNAKGDPLTPATVMYGASLTKAVFAYLVAQLADEGKVDLDTPIAAMLPKPLPEYGNLDAYGNWSDLADDPRWRTITPRMALTHSIGFANFAFIEPDGHLRIHFTPGTRYAYSGEGMMLLQFALEKGLVLDVGAELQRRFFTPLGMTDTSLKWQPAFAANLADGWKADDTPEPHDARSRVRVAGSMDTSIADLATFTAYMARGGGLSARMRAERVRPMLPITSASQFPTLGPDAPSGKRRADLAAALGIVVFSGPQGPGWYKGGHNDSTANTMVCLERRERCVLILSNDVRAEAAFPALVKTALGDTGVPYEWEYPLFPTRAPAQAGAQGPDRRPS